MQIRRESRGEIKVGSSFICAKIVENLMSTPP